MAWNFVDSREESKPCKNRIFIIYDTISLIKYKANRAFEYRGYLDFYILLKALKMILAIGLSHFSFKSTALFYKLSFSFCLIEIIRKLLQSVKLCHFIFT